MYTNIFQKENFVGKQALLKQMKEGRSKTFVQFYIQGHDVDTDIWPSGGESIYRNDQCVGYTSSAGYGFTSGQMICQGFVHHRNKHGVNIPLKTLDNWVLDKGAKYHIDIAGELFQATVKTSFSTKDNN